MKRVAEIAQRANAQLKLRGFVVEIKTEGDAA